MQMHQFQLANQLPIEIVRSFGKAKKATCVTFVSKYAYEHGIKEKLGLEKIVLPVRNKKFN